MKSSMWSFANIASTVCVSDDAVSIVMLTDIRSLTTAVLRKDPIVP